MKPAAPVTRVRISHRRQPSRGTGSKTMNRCVQQVDPVHGEFTFGSSVSGFPMRKAWSAPPPQVHGPSERSFGESGSSSYRWRRCRLRCVSGVIRTPNSPVRVHPTWVFLPGGTLFRGHCPTSGFHGPSSGSLDTQISVPKELVIGLRAGGFEATTSLGQGGEFWETPSHTAASNGSGGQPSGWQDRKRSAPPTHGYAGTQASSLYR